MKPNVVNSYIILDNDDKCLMTSTPSIDPNAVQDVDFFLYETPEEENNLKQKHSQVSFQNEKIKNLTQSRLPSTEEQ
eukprot:6438084-Ditylum_brightwellii.AAC.2